MIHATKKIDRVFGATSVVCHECGECLGKGMKAKIYHSLKDRVSHRVCVSCYNKLMFPPTESGKPIPVPGDHRRRPLPKSAKVEKKPVFVLKDLDYQDLKEYRQRVLIDLIDTVKKLNPDAEDFTRILASLYVKRSSLLMVESEMKSRVKGGS